MNKIFSLLFFTTIQLTQVFAQSHTTTDVYDRYIDAIGGTDAISKIKSVLTIELKISADKKKDSVITYKTDDMRYRTEFYEDLSLRYCSCFNGKYYWRTIPPSAPQIINSSLNVDRAFTINDRKKNKPIINKLISFKEINAPINLISTDTSKFHIIEQTEVDGYRNLYFIGKSDFILRKIEQYGNNSKFPMPLVLVLDDYRIVNSVLLPHNIKEEFSKYSSETQVLTYQLNHIFEDKIFNCIVKSE